MPRIPLFFPVNGQDDNTNYAQQMPNTSPDCNDVRPFDPIEKRDRGGSRPGLNKWYFAQVNGTQRIVSMTKAVESTTTAGTGATFRIGVFSSGGDELTTFDAALDNVNSIAAAVNFNAYSTVLTGANGDVYISADITASSNNVSRYNSADTLQWTSAANTGGGAAAYDETNDVLAVGYNGTSTINFLAESNGAVSYSTDIGRECQDMAYHEGHIYAVCETNTDYTGAGTTKSVFKIDGSDGSIVASANTGNTDAAAGGATRGSKIAIHNSGMIVVTNPDIIAAANHDGSVAADVWVFDTDLNVVTSFSDGYARGTDATLEPFFRDVCITNDRHIAILTDNGQFIYCKEDGTVLYSWNIYPPSKDDNGHQGIESDQNGNLYWITRGVDKVLQGNGQYYTTGNSAVDIYKVTVGSTKAEFVVTAHKSLNPAGAPRANTSARLAAEGITTRTVSLVVTDDSGDVSLIEDGVKKTVTGGSTALTADIFNHQAANAYSDVFIIDGTNEVYLDLATDTVATWTASTAGTLPTNPRLICRWRGRIVLAGLTTDPHNWFMSRVGDPFDWDYSPATTDAIQPVAGNIGETGLMGDVITGLCPYDDDILIVGMDQSIAKIAGDPAAGGAIDSITEATGMAWDAWTIDPDNRLWFMGVDGIYMMEGANAKPVNMTRGTLDNAFDAIDLNANRVLLEWDFRNKGLVVVVANIDTGETNQAYWYDDRKKGWFPFSWPASMGPDCMLAYDSDDPEDKALILGCRDGYLRKVTTAVDDDDGTDISSNVRFFPISTRTGVDTRMYGIEVTLAEGSSDVTLKVYTGQTAEQCNDSTTIRWARTLKAGRNVLTLPRLKGLWLQLELDCDDGKWGLESMFGLFEEGGRSRGVKR